MNNLKKYGQNMPTSIEVQNLQDIEEVSGNLYKSIYIISKRALQIKSLLHTELQHKLEEFSTHQDNLEEIFENREQIEISRHYERLPKPTIIALTEFLNGGTYFREADAEPKAD
ncbi:MAG: DNA-directed RNA polymerase subunit omega [Chitinophagales bacterium]